MEDHSEFQEPANLRFLRRLVTVLTATMIFGLLAIIALLVMRFWAAPATQFPTEIALPAGVTATAFTQGPDWIAVVSDDNQILIFDRSGKTLRQTIQITP